MEEILKKRGIKNGMVYRTHQAETMHNIFDSLENTCGDFLFHATKDEFFWNQMDVTNTFFTSGYFEVDKDNYYCTCETGCNIYIRLKTINNIFSMVSSERIFLFIYDKDKGDVIVELATQQGEKSETIECRTLDIADEHIQNEPIDPSQYLINIELQSADFQKIIKKFSKVQQDIMVQIICERIDKYVDLSFRYKDIVHGTITSKRRLQVKNLTVNPLATVENKPLKNVVDLNQYDLDNITEMLIQNNNTKEATGFVSTFMDMKQDYIESTFPIKILSASSKISSVSKSVMVRLALGKGRDGEVLIPLVLEYTAPRCAVVKIAILPTYTDEELTGGGNKRRKLNDEDGAVF